MDDHVALAAGLAPAALVGRRKMLKTHGLKERARHLTECNAHVRVDRHVVREVADVRRGALEDSRLHRGSLEDAVDGSWCAFGDSRVRMDSEEGRGQGAQRWRNLSCSLLVARTMFLAG